MIAGSAPAPCARHRRTPGRRTRAPLVRSEAAAVAVSIGMPAPKPIPSPAIRAGRSSSRGWMRISAPSSWATAKNRSKRSSASSSPRTCVRDLDSEEAGAGHAPAQLGDGEVGILQRHRAQRGEPGGVFRDDPGEEVILGFGQFRRAGGVGLVTEGHRDRRDHLERRHRRGPYRPAGRPVTSSDGRSADSVARRSAAMRWSPRCAPHSASGHHRGFGSGQAGPDRRHGCARRSGRGTSER